jgi:hypothetical protein
MDSHLLVTSSPVPRISNQDLLAERERLSKFKKNALTDFDDILDQQNTGLPPSSSRQPSRDSRKRTEPSRLTTPSRQRPKTTTCAQELTSSQKDLQDSESCEIISKLIRDELTSPVGNEDQSLFFGNISGWEEDETDCDLIKVLNIEDGPSYNYLKCDATRDKEEVKQKKLTKRSGKPSWDRPRSPKPGFRTTAKNGWGDEEEPHKPYALQVPADPAVKSKDGEDEINDETSKVKTTDDLNPPLGATPYQTAKFTASKNKLSDNSSSMDKVMEIEIAKLIQSAAVECSSRTIRKSKSAKVMSAMSHQDRILASTITAALCKTNLNKRPPTPIAIQGLKYKNQISEKSKLKLAQKSSSRPGTSGKSSEATLPRISSSSSSSGRKLEHNTELSQPQLNSHKVASPRPPSSNNLNGLMIGQERFEIPKWYEEEVKKDAYDKNLKRFMEIVGQERMGVRFRSPKKLSSTGFQAMPMAPVPPEYQGFVIKRELNSSSSISVRPPSLDLKAKRIKNVGKYEVRSFRQEMEQKRSTIELSMTRPHHPSPFPSS